MQNRTSLRGPTRHKTARKRKSGRSARNDGVVVGSDGELGGRLEEEEMEEAREGVDDE